MPASDNHETRTNTEPLSQAASDDLPVLTPEDHLKHLAVEAEQGGLFVSLSRGIKELISPPKLPPLKLTSRPVQVKDIWGLYGHQKRAWASSMGIHVAVVTLAFALAGSRTVRVAASKAVTLIAPDIAPYLPQAEKPKQMGGGGGGGDRSPLPASKGKLPRVAPRQFTPPSVTPPPNPKLIMEPTIVVPADVNLPNVNMAQYGDPLGRIGPPSSGTGSGGGIGSGSGGGVGPGSGPGYGPGSGGGFGGGVYPRTVPSRGTPSEGSSPTVWRRRAGCEVAGHNQSPEIPGHLSRTRPTRVRSPP